MLGRSISRNSMILGLFAAVTASAIAVTFQTTKSRITAEERKAASAALIAMVPKSRHNNDMLTDTQRLSTQDREALGLPMADAEMHIARQDESIIAFVVPTIAKDGYSGDIKMLIAVNIDGTLAGVRIISHKETPGLGDKVELRKSDWVLEFDGRSLSNPAIEFWKVKKEGGIFDQFTGATITPRAVINRVKNTLLLFRERKSEWINQAKPGQAAKQIVTTEINYE